MRLVPDRTRAPGDVSSLHSDVERIVERFFAGSLEGSPAGELPIVDVEETSDEVRVTAVVSDVEPEDVDVQVDGRRLTLRAEKEVAWRRGRPGARRSGRRRSVFRRRVPLPAEVDPERVHARLGHGVVTVRMKKAASLRAEA